MPFIKQNFVLILLVICAGFLAYQAYSLRVLDRSYQSMKAEIRLLESQISCYQKLARIYSEVRKRGDVATTEDLLVLESLECFREEI
ncbi:hypothetical protein KKI24_10085 [bacterium]|nr:hypothetical protein [bacterium]